MSCVSRTDFCVTRGSRAEHMTTLRAGYDAVVEAPSSYQGRLVFRETQDDFAPELFAITVTPEVVEEPVGSGEMVAVMHFVVAGSLTQTLPEYDIAAFVELREIGGDNERLYNMRVDMGD